MTISSTLARNDYSGSAAVGPYVYAFKITAATDLQVIKRSVAGVETTLTYLTDYTVAGAGNDAGGSITLTSAPLSTDTLSIRRALPITQPASIRNQGSYLPETIEDQLDRAVLIQQQQEDAIARSLKLPPSYNPAGRARHLVPTAGYVVVGDGAGFTTAVVDRTGVTLPGAGRTVATLSAYLANNAWFNVKDYGAVGDGVTEDTVAITAAVTAARAVTGGATVYFPPGRYSSGPLDLSNGTADFSKHVRLLGAGRLNTALVANASAAGLVFLDMLGTNNWSMEGLTIDSQGAVTQCGLLLARSTTSQNCNDNRFSDVEVIGNFSKACVISIGAESTKWFRSRFTNTSAAANYTQLYSSNSNGIGVTSARGTIMATAPNTDNTMEQCEFYGPYVGAQLTVFVDNAGYRFSLCSWIGSGASTRLITLKAVTGSIFNGPMEFVASHWEYFGSGSVGSVIYLDPNGTTGYFKGLNVFGGRHVSDAGAFIDFNRTAPANQPILLDSTITTVRADIGIPDQTIYSYGIQSCHITWLASDANATVVALGSVQDSTVKALAYYAPVTAVAYSYDSNASAVPTTGTYQKGQRIKNVAGTIGQPTGWVCSTAGTLGTLNGGATAATTTSGSKVITVSSATGLHAGQLIAIAGAAGGPFVVWNISGTTVTLGANVGTTLAGAAVSFSAAVLTALPNL